MHAETNHTFASAKTFPGHSLKKKEYNHENGPINTTKNLPPPKAENKVPWVRLVGFFPVLVHEPLWVK